MAKVKTQGKIDPSILLELVNKGLKQAEIARYFDVQPSSVRSKLLSLSRRNPEFSQALSQKKETLTDETASLSNRLDSYAIKMFSDAGNVLKRLQVTPIPDDIPGMILRSDLQLKGLQIVERIQKILGMNQGLKSNLHSLPKNEVGGRGVVKNNIARKTETPGPLLASDISIYGP